MKTLQDVIQAVESDARGKVDYLTPVNNLKAEEGRITLIDPAKVKGPKLEVATFEPTDWAEGQLMTRLGMPGHYFKKAKEEDPELFSQHFNHWAKKSDKETILRTKILNSEIGLLRGSVGKDYGILDNTTVMETLLKILEGNEGDYNVEDFYLDDRRFHLRMTYPDTTKEIRKLPDGRPDLNQLGTDIVNSEVGASSFNLQALIWRLICSNGLRSWSRSGDGYIQRHAFLNPIEFQGRIASAMVNTLQSGHNFLEEFKRTQEQKIENPFAVIKKLAKENGYSRVFTDTLQEQYEGDNTAYGVINAFTRAARGQRNDARLETEKFAGKLIQLRPRDWEKLDELELSEVS